MQLNSDLWTTVYHYVLIGGGSLLAGQSEREARRVCVAETPFLLSEKSDIIQRLDAVHYQRDRPLVPADRRNNETVGSNEAS